MILWFSSTRGGQTDRFTEDFESLYCYRLQGGNDIRIAKVSWRLFIPSLLLRHMSNTSSIRCDVYDIMSWNYTATLSAGPYDRGVFVIAIHSRSRRYYIICVFSHFMQPHNEMIKTTFAGRQTPASDNNSHIMYSHISWYIYVFKTRICNTRFVFFPVIPFE